MTRKRWKEEGDLEAGIDDLRRNRSITDHGRRERNEPNILDQVARLSASKFTRLKSNHTIQETVNDVAAVTSKFIFMGPKGLAEWPHTI